MIEKRIQKLWKLLVLAGIRQFWKLGCNLYHLSYEPYLTIKTIKEERSKSQIGLMFLVILSPAIIYTMVRIFWDKYWYGEVLKSAGWLFIGAGVIQVFILTYFLFWTWQVWRKK